MIMIHGNSPEYWRHLHRSCRRIPPGLACSRACALELAIGPCMCCSKRIPYEKTIGKWWFNLMRFNEVSTSTTIYKGACQNLWTYKCGCGVNTTINPSYFDVHQGYKVLTQSHMNVVQEVKAPSSTSSPGIRGDTHLQVNNRLKWVHQFI